VAKQMHLPDDGAVHVRARRLRGDGRGEQPFVLPGGAAVPQAESFVRPCLLA
jgi:hypothetical protein